MFEFRIGGMHSMSAILELNIKTDLNKCQNIDDIDAIKEKYNYSFKNAVDASEFTKMISIAKMRVLSKLN